jgi:hypothetical protein
LRNKVVIETSVLVAASVHAFIEGTEEPIEDEYFDRSMQLVGYLRTNVTKRIGVVTPTAEREARGAIITVLKRLLEEKGTMTIPSLILGACNDRLRRTVQTMVREPMNREMVDELFVRVTGMYALLNQRAALLDKGTIRAVGREQAKVAASPRYRHIARKIYTEQQYDKYSQLRRLITDPASPNDMMQLAETAYLLRIYSEETETTMYLASTDTHFSPYTEDGTVVSSIVTDQILEDFSIHCDWPEHIVAAIQESERSQSN